MSDSEDPPSPDYVPGPEEPEQAPPSPIYVPFVPEPVYPEFLPEDDVLPAEEQPLPVAASPTTESPGYIPESDPEEDPEEDDEEDPEEDPADYPADRGDDDDDDDAEEEEHLAPADPAAVAYSADQDPYLAYRVTARMSIRPQAPAPFLSEEVAERFNEACRTNLVLDTEVGRFLKSSAAGTARQVGPATARADLYGFADMLDAAPGRQTSRELGYGITDTWDDLLDDARHDRALLRARVNMLYRDRPFHRRTALLMEEEARVSRAAWVQSMDACDQETDGDYRSAESRPSETEIVSGGTKDSGNASRTQDDLSFRASREDMLWITAEPVVQSEAKKWHKRMKAHEVKPAANSKHQSQDTYTPLRSQCPTSAMIAEGFTACIGGTCYDPKWRDSQYIGKMFEKGMNTLFWECIIKTS
ncbi:hypothetical protein Tco_0802335 [Tanacetum coccineum]|uniref:Uncharacterized protein n=1 Tax=Tanacetum coccineum TaxID=301880 RepID=A0ABQ5A2P9_9ASTR